MKKVYLFLLIPVLAILGFSRPTFAQCNVNSIDSFEATDPIDMQYPYGFVMGSYSPDYEILEGSLFYEGNFIGQYTFEAGFIFLGDLMPGDYYLETCAGIEYFTINPLSCDMEVLYYSTVDIPAAGCGNTGMMDFTVTSSSPQTFYYQLTNMDNFDVYNGTDDGFGLIHIDQLPAGTYMVQISTDMDIDNSSCVYTNFLTINEPSCDMSIPTINVTNASGPNDMDGSILVTVSGLSCLNGPGGPSYIVYAEYGGVYFGDLTYNSGSGTYTLDNLAPGDYTIIASNGSNSCFASELGTVGIDNNGGCNIPTPVINVKNTTVICNGEPSKLDVGYGYDSYQWVYNGSVLIPTSIAGTDHEYWAYLEGNYSCIVTLNGCTATSNSVFVSAPLSPPINFPDTIYSCDNSITLTAPDDFDTYLWSTFETTVSTTITNDGWYGLAAGVSSMQCGVVDTFYVSLNNTSPVADINIIGNNPFCEGTSVFLETSSNDNILWSTGETTSTIEITDGGTYSLTVTNTYGCEDVNSVTLSTQVCVPPTQITGGACGNMTLVKTSAIISTPVAGATQYEFEFSNTNGVYAVKFTPNNYVLLHSVTPTIDWGTTWSIRVRAYIGNLYGAWSTPCTIGLVPDPSQNATPTTKLRPEDCGRLNYRINANNRIVANQVLGAVQYEFEFSELGSGNIIASEVRPNKVLFFNTMSPILPYPAQYNVRVRTRAGGSGTWSPWGDYCLIGIIGLNKEAAPSFDNAIDVDGPYFDLAAVPNPFNEVTSLVINSSENENINIKIFDLTGKLVEELNATTNNKVVVGAELSKGVYLVKAMTESGNETIVRLVKTN